MEARKARVLSVRTCDDIVARIETFRKAQLALPTQTEALRVLVKLGFDKWEEQHKRAVDAR